MRILGHVMLALGILFSSVHAGAEEPAVLSTAREIAKEGFRAYDEGRYEEAAAKSLRAYQVVRVPTLAVNRARALVKLGRWIEAAELYLEATRLPRATTWQAIQDDAIRDAERERSELLPRIPRLKIRLLSAKPDSVEVTVNGVTVPTALLDADQLVDPRPCIVVGNRQGEVVRAQVLPVENDRQTVTLRFLALSTSDGKRDGLELSNGAQKKSEPTNVKNWVGYGAIGLGAASLTLGTIEALRARAHRTWLLDSGHCSDSQHCDSTVASRVDSYRLARTMTQVGLTAGGILVAAGVTLVLWPNKHAEARTASILFGVNYIGVGGTIE